MCFYFLDGANNKSAFTFHVIFFFLFILFRQLLSCTKRDACFSMCNHLYNKKVMCKLSITHMHLVLENFKRFNFFNLNITKIISVTFAFLVTINYNFIGHNTCLYIICCFIFLPQN